MPTAREGNAKAALLKYINHIQIIENYACKQEEHQQQLTRHVRHALEMTIWL